MVEILIWTLRGKPLPVNGISGGEWFLVIFLSLIGTGLYAFHTRVGWPPTRIRMHGIEMFGEAFDYTIEEKKTQIGKNRRVILENLRGNSRITGADTTDIIVSGRKTVRSMSRDSADNVNRNTQLEVIEQADAIVIRTNQNRAAEERYVTADLEITLPKGVNIQARGRDGDFEINNLQGRVEIDSDHAGVRVQNLGGDLRVNVRRSDLIRAQSVQGTVELQGRGNDVELENVQGQVTIDGSWGGELHFRNLAKPVRFQGIQAELQVQKNNQRSPAGPRLPERRFHHRANNSSRPHERLLRCTSHRLQFVSRNRSSARRRGSQAWPAVTKNGCRSSKRHCRSGDTRDAKFTLKAQVAKGEVENEYGDALRVSDEGRGGSITGNVGEGPSIAITTERGHIAIRKADDTPQ